MKFYWPLKTVFVTQAFGRKSSAYPMGYHMGIDLRAPKNTPVYAAQAGKVVVAKNMPPYDGYGAHVVIDHGEGLYSVYGHLDVVVAKLGARVKLGELIGYSGGNPHDYGALGKSMKVNGKFTKAGNSTAPHLHYEIDQGGIGARFCINPTPLTSFNNNLDMPQEIIPDWAGPALAKARKKGFKMPDADQPPTKYELAVYFDKLGLLDKLPDV